MAPMPQSLVAEPPMASVMSLTPRAMASAISSPVP